LFAGGPILHVSLTISAPALTNVLGKLATAHLFFYLVHSIIVASFHWCYNKCPLSSVFIAQGFCCVKSITFHPGRKKG